MKKCKTVLSLLLCLLLCVNLTACMGNSDDFHASVFYYTFSDTYVSGVRTELDKALKNAGIAYQNYDAASNQTTQNEQIDTAISKGTDLLIVNIVTSGSNDATQTILDKANAANVPVIFFNRAIEDDKSEGMILSKHENIAYVGTDAPEAGHLQGEMIGNYVKDHFEEMDLNGDGEISYAMFMGQLGNTEAIYRTHFAVEDANKILTDASLPKLRFFDPSNTDKYQVDQDGNWSATAANNYMTTNLTQFNEENNNMIELVICNNDGMAEGVISALNDKGYNLGTADSVTIPVFGVDATDAAKDLIKAGKMTGTVKQDAKGMAEGILHLATNVRDEKNLMDNTEKFHISEQYANKMYIPYTGYTGD